MERRCLYWNRAQVSHVVWHDQWPSKNTRFSRYRLTLWGMRTHVFTSKLDHQWYWYNSNNNNNHYDDVIMSTIASQITSLTIVYSTIYSGADQSKHQSPASLAFCVGNSPGPVNSPHKGPVTRKMFPFDDVIMNACLWFFSLCTIISYIGYDIL